MPRWGALIVLVAAAAAAAGLALSRGTASAAGAGPEKRKAPQAKPFVVQSIAPRHGAKFVDLAADVVVRFSGAVDPATVTAQNVIVRRLLETERIEWTWRTRNGGKTLVLAPKAPLEPGADYEVVVTRGVRRKDGARLARRKRVIFFTDPRFSPYPILRPDMFEDLEATMREPRAAHSATLVAGGLVLLAGGLSDQSAMCRGAEVYEPQTKSFRMLTTLLGTRRAYHAGTGLLSGNAVLIGGFDGVGTALASTEVYERQTSSLVPGAPMNEPRDFLAAVLLKDGRVLVTGGLRYTGSGAIYSTTAEIRETDGTWRFTAGKPIRRRAGHTLTELPDGTVLVVGGTSALSGIAATVEIFDPVTETFRAGANLPRNHRQLHTATLIDVGDPTAQHVLIADGGDPVAEMYDDAGEQLFAAGGASFDNRTRATASLLPAGDVLLAGGLDQRGTTTAILSSMDLYVRSAGGFGRVFSVNVVFSKPRAGHTATTLTDDTVLFAGGFDQNGGINLETAVLFTPPPAAEAAKK